MLAKDFINKTDLTGNYILEGDDAYLRNAVIKAARSHLPGGLEQFNWATLDGTKDVGINAVTELMITPAMSDIRIVYIKEVKEKQTKESLEWLKKYLDDPSDSSVLIINDEHGMLTSLKKNVVRVDCGSLTGADSIEFVKKRSQELGGAINHAGAKLLGEYCQYDMMRIDAELRKLIEFKEGGIINDTDVAEFVHADIDFEIYEIANAVGDKNLKKALVVIGNLMQGGFKASDVLSQLSRAFRRMLYIKLSTLPDEELARILEIKPFAVKKTRSRADKFSPVKLKKIYDNINEMEFKFKSGVMTDNSALDDALINIFS